VRMRPGCGRALLDALDEELFGGERVGIAVPLLYERGAAEPSRSLRRAPTVARALGEAVLGNRRAGRFPRWGELVTDPAAYAGPTRADWATGALMALSARCLGVCGPWRESFFLYSEETEFCLRAGDRGLATRLVPSASAVHLGGQSQVSPYLWTLLTANRVRLFRLRHGAGASVLFWAAVTLREVSRAAIGKRASRAAAATLLRPWLLARPPGPATPPGAAADAAADAAQARPTAPGGAGRPGR
jgi:N-acetylglucosaminyl-diphospho-decaprenol L-rhamnosyltransferase